MCSENSASLEISYGHLAEMQSLLAIWLTDVPRDMLQIFDEVLQSVVLADFPHYAKVWLSRPVCTLGRSLRLAFTFNKRCFFVIDREGDPHSHHRFTSAGSSPRPPPK